MTHGSTKHHRLKKSERGKAGRTASRMPAWVVTVAGDLGGHHRKGRLGKLGPASPVRHIDPKTGEVIEHADPA